MAPKRKKGSRARHLRPVPAPDPEAGPPWKVVWHSDAAAERAAIQDATERVALQHAGDKLVAIGPQLRFPHRSAVQGEDGKGLSELRPRAGRSPWRGIYRQVNKSTFVVFAVAPEAQVDGRGFDAAVRRAKQRFEELQT